MNRRRFLRASLGVTAAWALPVSLSRPLFAANLPADITAMDALTLSRAIRDRDVSCVEVMQSYLSRIHRYNPVYNAIVSLVDDDTLLQQAHQADQALARGDYAGWMHGMPQAAKDLTAVAGLPHTSGSLLYVDRIADEDSALSASLRRAGAIFIGKTNTPEFGLGSQSYNPIFGATGSAWDPARTAGGSSGGAAAGLGTQMLPVADGSDMMGSLRNPGAFNNVIGFRPSTDVMRSSDEPHRALSTAGPMGRNTADTIRLLQTIAVKPIGDNFVPRDLRGLRLGWLGDFDGYLPMEQGVMPLCEAALQVLVDAGASVEAVQPRVDPAQLWQCWITLRHSSRDSYRRFYDDPAQRELLKPELIYEIEHGMTLSEQDIASARDIRQRWIHDLERMFEHYDYLLMPTSQVFPFDKNVHWPEQIAGRRMDTYHRWMESVIPGSLGGLPVLNVPVGFNAARLPMGMQVMGPYGDDRQVLAFGLAYELVTDFLQQQPGF